MRKSSLSQDTRVGSFVPFIFGLTQPPLHSDYSMFPIVIGLLSFYTIVGLLSFYTN
jgi:hypothetical protein